MRGLWTRFGAAAGVLVIAFITSVVVLNQTVYTPVGFVRGYLDALARHDVAAALALAGPLPSSSAVDDFLTTEVLSDLESYTVEETTEVSGVHTVTAEYVADGREGRTSFQVERSSAVLGMFPTWRFASSPLAEVELTVLHARDFTANGVRFVAPVQDVASTYLAFTPGVISLGHRSSFFEAAPQTVVLGSPKSDRTITVDAQANAAFTALVDEQIRTYLDDCAAQQVLYPRGCPFGQPIDDPRLASAPLWSITQYPTATVLATPIPGEWSVPQTPGSARIQVDVLDTYDGSIISLDTTVPFSVGFVVTFVGANEVVLTPEVGAVG